MTSKAEFSSESLVLVAVSIYVFSWCSYDTPHYHTVFYKIISRTMEQSAVNYISCDCWNLTNKFDNDDEDDNDNDDDDDNNDDDDDNDDDGDDNDNDNDDDDDDYEDDDYDDYEGDYWW